MYDKGFYKRSRGFCVGVCNVSVWVTMWDSLRATKSYFIRLPVRVTCSETGRSQVRDTLIIIRFHKNFSFAGHRRWKSWGPKIKSITAQPEERRLDSL